MWQLEAVRSLVVEVKANGLRPNPVASMRSSHAKVNQGSPSRRAEIWDAVKEVQDNGAKPNQSQVQSSCEVSELIQ